MIRALVTAALLLTGCADGTVPPPSPSHPASAAAAEGTSEVASKAEAMPEEHHDHDHATAYTCPMHPEVVSDKPGQCPKCGMNLVPRGAP